MLSRTSKSWQHSTSLIIMLSRKIINRVNVVPVWLSVTVNKVLFIRAWRCVTKRYYTVAMTQESINFDLEQIYSIPYIHVLCWFYNIEIIINLTYIACFVSFTLMCCYNVGSIDSSDDYWTIHIYYAKQNRETLWGKKRKQRLKVFSRAAH